MINKLANRISFSYPFCVYRLAV